MSAESHLAKFGITVQQAKDYIYSNIRQPEILFETAFEYGVTTAMLGEITGYPIGTVGDYFRSVDTMHRSLDDTSILVNSDLGSLQHLVGFNSRTGMLSNFSLGELVRQKLDNPLNYDPTFELPVKNYQTTDGIYDAEELGVNLDIPATKENVESLFYGSLINMFLALNEAELDQINAFPRNDKPEEFQALLFNALSESTTSAAWTDDDLVNLVKDEAVNIIDKYWDSNDDIFSVGLLDYSFLGLATA